jgi:hypothetical protein
MRRGMASLYSPWDHNVKWLDEGEDLPFEGVGRGGVRTTVVPTRVGSGATIAAPKPRGTEAGGVERGLGRGMVHQMWTPTVKTYRVVEIETQYLIYTYTLYIYKIQGLKRLIFLDRIFSNE